jgi:hypothetical protein
VQLAAAGIDRRLAVAEPDGRTTCFSLGEDPPCPNKETEPMIRVLSTLCLSSLALLAASFSVLQPASAQDFELQIGPDGIRPRLVDPEEDYEYRSYRRPRVRCDLDLATDIARDEGLRRPRVVDVTERRVVVRGRTAYGRETIVFANRRGCPIAAEGGDAP